MTLEEAHQLKLGDMIANKWTCTVSTVSHNTGLRICHWHKPFDYSYSSADECLDEKWAADHKKYIEMTP